MRAVGEGSSPSAFKVVQQKAANIFDLNKDPEAEVQQQAVGVSVGCHKQIEKKGVYGQACDLVEH